MSVVGFAGWFWIGIELTMDWEIGSRLSRDWQMDGLPDQHWMGRLVKVLHIGQGKASWIDTELLDWCWIGGLVIFWQIGERLVDRSWIGTGFADWCWIGRFVEDRHRNWRWIGGLLIDYGIGPCLATDWHLALR